MMLSIRKLITILAAVFALGLLSAHALIINATFDTSVTTAPEATQIESAINWAVQTYGNQFTNPITVNITMYWGGSVDLGQVGLGGSYTTYVGSSDFAYPQLTNALRSARNSIYDSNSVASLPLADPTGSGNSWYVPRAEAKALKLTSLGVGLNDSTEDGEVGFGTNGISYTFNPTNRIVAGEYDFIGVAEHEITEVMGRSTLGLDLDGGTDFVPFDLFRFTGSGVRSFDYYATDAYFSINNGVTDLKDFNDGGANGGDIQDWATGATPDSYDAFTSAGEEGILSTNDFIAMDILGYNSPGILHAHVTGTSLANGDFQLSFTNLAATSFSVLSSTNLSAPLANWTVLGTAVEYPVGQLTSLMLPAGRNGFTSFVRLEALLFTAEARRRGVGFSTTDGH